MDKKIVLKINQVYRFELEGHAASGYLWFAESYKENIVSVNLDTVSKSIDTGDFKAGGSAKVVVVIKAISKGKSKIVLVEKRPWEIGTAPINSIELSVTVTD